MLPILKCKFCHLVQGDPSLSSKPSVDIKTKVPFWPGQARTGQTKAELLFKSQQEVLNKWNCHPVLMTSDKKSATSNTGCT